MNPNCVQCFLSLFSLSIIYVVKAFLLILLLLASYIHLLAVSEGGELQDGPAADGRGGAEGELAYIYYAEKAPTILQGILDLLLSRIVDR